VRNAPVWQRDDAPVGIGRKAIEARPDIAVAMQVVLAAWADLQSVVSEAYAILLFGEEPTALDSFLEFQGAENQQRFFITAAQRRLEADDLRIVETLLAGYRNGGDDRTLVAHGTWAAADVEGLDDAVLFVDTNQRTRAVFELCKSGKAVSLNNTELTPQNYRVFRKVDFEQMALQIDSLRQEWFAFVQRLLDRGNTIAARRSPRSGEIQRFGDFLG
jgi:hypothetical protein